jgi:hypothetical protein
LGTCIWSGVQIIPRGEFISIRIARISRTAGMMSDRIIGMSGHGSGHELAARRRGGTRGYWFVGDALTDLQCIRRPGGYRLSA